MKKVSAAAIILLVSACSAPVQIYQDAVVPEAEDFRDMSTLGGMAIDKASGSVFISANGEACVRKSSAASACEVDGGVIEVRDVISGTF